MATIKITEWNPNTANIVVTCGERINVILSDAFSASSLLTTNDDETVAFGSRILELADDELTSQIAFGDVIPEAVSWIATGKEDLSSKSAIINAAADATIVALSLGILKEKFSSDEYVADPEIKSSYLRAVVAILMIENLFPNLPWSTHKEEALASAFHSLAAMFLKLGDTLSAEDCISQSEPLDDSPRALALRAIISRRKGETLGAVANMVSSLQQYEQRKKDNGTHYTTFSPRNIEVVNNKLKAGLEALNQRDNEAALGNFSDAVFEFDGFYAQFGLELIRS